MTVAASDSIARSASTFAHQRLVDEQRAERARGARRGRSPARRPARIPPAAPSTQSRRVWLTISMIVGTPRPGSPTMPRPRAVELDLARRVRAVAELVLEALDAEARCACRRAGRAAAAKHERPSSVCASTRNTSHIGARAEPLVAGELVLGAGPPPLSGVATRRVGAHVGAALLLGHRHAAERAGLLGGGPQLAGRRSASVSSGTHSAASSGCARSAGTAA